MAENQEEEELVWACGGDQPSSQEITQRGVPLCLEISSGNGGTNNKITNINLPELPTRSLCLAAEEDLTQPPSWCYQLNSEPEFHLWFSSCDKCGTAWRLFKERKDDESWYKLPTSDMPNASDIALPVDSIYDNGDPVGEATAPWLGWNKGQRDWNDGDIFIRPCQGYNDTQLPPPCFISKSELATSSSGMNDVALIVAISFGAVVCAIVSCGMWKFGCPDEESRGSYGYGGGGGGGGASCGGC